MKANREKNTQSRPAVCRPWDCLSVLLPLLVLAMLMPQAVRGEQSPPGDSVYALSATVQNEKGETLRWQDLRGQPRLVSMVYTRCRMSCPLIIHQGMSVQQRLLEEGSAVPRLLIISMDPDHDTPDVLAGTMARYRLTPGRATFLRPRDHQERTIAALLDIRFRQRDDGGFDHTNAWLLLDADGRIVARTEKMAGAPDPAFVREVEAVMAAYHSQAQGDH
ncbi:SCO family protein [Alloalcanivorax xenomutans]|uniref:SCO family protein n=1 Tax=Alloalcanivorax xenomutans TaxID=1094342 RepID=UPI0029348430|nr:SCO family protein [Alloalcanivorax xenomutans]WOD29669.1 SCO family protein [Alloalcanivorax xenomutans]